ncbi:MAG: hypothetical protein MPEBLZ_03253 [Candidatus Methanoperedens nitroreducens]|uniref:Uncharacterized protein n=1 Tax=Candidatus Methanoperedens nitratireducens TaxID=1392998 RepID=A0A0P8DX04_9EURY|nr:MAG: hypothetical protein MPEBLZ_03253 [Candidatus Methanoperedens sp. BLZ1]
MSLTIISNGRIVSSAIVPSDVERTTNKGIANGYAGLDAALKFAGLLAADTAEKTANKGIANGYAGLDASTLLALTQQRLNFKLVDANHDTSAASGNQAVTGAGFMPRFVIMQCSVPSVPGQSSIGWSDGTTHHCLSNQYNLVAGSWGFNPALGYLFESGAVKSQITVASLDADGCTLSWTKIGAKTGIAQIAIAFIR